MFPILGDLFSTAFKPFSAIPGLNVMGNMAGYTANNSYNPFSLSSLGKMPGYVAGGIGNIGNSITGNNLGTGQSQDAMKKQMLMRMFLAKIGKK